MSKKTLTKLQERIVARVLADPMNTLYLSKGNVNSAKSLIEKGLLSKHCYASMVQSQYLTPEIKSVFFGDNDVVFAIQDIYDNCWLIFEDRKLVAKPRSEEMANRIVKALKLLRQHEMPGLVASLAPEQMAAALTNETVDV
ncbi:hypothetical protein [Bradyrhizobium sp. DASA03007]|uniref:hypothetical protein n=1 Tax=unclassified Bradyrhizobium TaxID=2631580 RepID=UPI003F70C35E